MVVGIEQQISTNQDRHLYDYANLYMHHRDCRGGLCVRPDSGAHAGAPLPTIVQWFKTMTTNEYIRRAKENSANPDGLKLWQTQNYYEHVIRNEKALNALRQYIVAKSAELAR